ncbi:hypothetical protein BKA56DRAFT_600828 [Ilyonectria sp. MPI-CAGE-AT-0026]|nr:hypothetical protein BKA56DRAFT_600828 [Ilyonectria sp. MPI-CAGE-AT-0026]
MAVALAIASRGAGRADRSSGWGARTTKYRRAQKVCRRANSSPGGGCDLDVAAWGARVGWALVMSLAPISMTG